MDYGRRKLPKTNHTPLMEYKGHKVFLTKREIALYAAWGVNLSAGYNKDILVSPNFAKLPRDKQTEILEHEVIEKRYFKKHLVERVEQLGDESHTFAEEQLAKKKRRGALIPW